MRLEGKVAIVTGATAGMGRAAAELFAQEGASVVLCGRRESLGQEIVDVIKGRGGEATFVTADVAKAEDVKKVVDTAVSSYGKLDVLFNNAGIDYSGYGEADKEPEEAWDHVIDVNLKGTFLGIKYAVPEMRKAGGGSIINNSSVNDSQAGAASIHLFLPRFQGRRNGPHQEGRSGLRRREHPGQCSQPRPDSHRNGRHPVGQALRPRHHRDPREIAAHAPYGPPNGCRLCRPLLRLRRVGVRNWRHPDHRRRASGGLPGRRLAKRFGVIIIRSSPERFSSLLTRD